MKYAIRLSLCALGLVLLPGCSEERLAVAPPEMEKVERRMDWSQPYIVVEPETTRSIQGVSEVDRKRYFSVCDQGVGFEGRVKDDAMYDYLVHELGISFGRDLGPVKGPAKTLQEDPNRPGFADLTPILKQAGVKAPSERMVRDFGPNLDVASHGAHNAFPEFMGRHTTPESLKDKPEEYIPENIEAAALLSAAVLKHNFTDLERPRYYEPVNEPHWGYFGDPHFADWHMKTKDEVQKATPDVLVGGPCMSVSYFYRGNYNSFNGIKNLIDNTDGTLDFYSFHAYDYLRWRDDEFRGRIQSGLTLENSLDVLQNYAFNTLGREVDVVVSEQGGYIHMEPKGTYDGESIAGELAAKYFPDEDKSSWEFEMKKRSIVCFGHVSSILANTLAFMDHPHVVKKAVPFLLVNTWSWDPKYYANLYVPYQYQDRSRWVETPMTDFYKFFRGVAGRRVKALCSDPDLQTRAFVDGSKLYLAVNNQSWRPESVDLYGVNTAEVTLRRFGRHSDFTGYFSEQTVTTPKSLTLAGRESVMLIAEYGEPVTEKQAINEIVCYGDKTAVPLEEATFSVQVPHDKPIDYAQLRVGFTRPPGLSQTPMITFNGNALPVPLEDCADRLTDKEYATTKLIYLDPEDVLAENAVAVSFADGTDGYVGSVVIRIAVKLPPAPTVSSWK